MASFFRKRSYQRVAPSDHHDDDDDDHDDNDKNQKDSKKIIENIQLPITATLSRLLLLARPERHLMIVSGITMAFSSAVSLAVPSYSGKIIDLALQDQDDDDSGESPMRLLLTLLGYMTAASVAGFFRTYWQAQAGHRLVARLRRKLYAAILSQDAAYFDSINPGDLISRLSADAQLINSAVTDQALGLFRNLMIAIGAVIMLFCTSISLALVSVAILPPIAICARIMGRRMRERHKRVQELHASATSLAEQALTCIRTVHQFVAESWEAQQYNRAINQAHGEALKNMKLKALFGSVMQLVINLALLCVLGFGGTLVRRRILTPGDLASFVMYSVMMGTNVSGISSQYVDLMKAIAAANRVFEIVDREPPIPPPQIEDPPENEILWSADDKEEDQGTTTTTLAINTTATALPSWEQKTGNKSMELMELGSYFASTSDPSSTIVMPMSVDFENVIFSYPTRPDSKVLKGLNLSIPKGQAVALVGGSGAGKSTIASLLTRLYDPHSGTIRLGGTSIRDMAPQEVRRKIGIVVQEPLLFPSTIEANIRYGSPHATDEQVREAARLAYVLDFADKFPDGLQTVVGPRGTQLSGGQKQRVAVARCILKDPPVVIFDEATSALDAESESQVQRAIETACQGRTVIMIAHRLSTIRNADAIAVLKDGQVAELGSFETLMKDPDGAFRQLMDKQLVLQ